MLSLTSPMLLALSCLLILIIIILFILRRPGLSLAPLSLIALLHPIPTPLLSPSPFSPSPFSPRHRDLESAIQSTQRPLNTASTFSSRSTSPAASSASLYSETAATIPITWRDPWTWRFRRGERNGDAEGRIDDEEKQVGGGGPGSPESPLGLSRYFFEGGVGIREM